MPPPTSADPLSPPTPSLRAALIWAAVGVGLTIALLVVLSPLDLPIAQSLVGHRDDRFAVFVHHWGRKPATLLIVASSFVLAVRAWRDAYPLGRRAAAALVVHLVVHPGVLTNLSKLLSSRPRPVHLDATGASFVPFYKALHPGFGDFSFPSGHVAIAMILAPCAVLLWLDKRRAAAMGLAMVTLGWAGAVGFGRVLGGAHFLTDVVFSVGLGIALAPLSLRLGDRLVGVLTRRSRGG